MAPTRTDEADTTHEGVTNNTVPCVATAGTNKTVLPSDTIKGIVETTDNQGNIMSLVHIQCMYKSSVPGTSGSINNCHVAIQAPSGWTIANQNKSDFCTLSSDKKHLVLNYISQFHALRVSLALKKGIALERWANGLSVMLEKMFGVRLVSKLWAILLMEADFNAKNKEVYGVRMLEEA